MRLGREGGRGSERVMEQKKMMRIHLFLDDVREKYNTENCCIISTKQDTLNIAAEGLISLGLSSFVIFFLLH